MQSTQRSNVSVSCCFYGISMRFRLLASPFRRASYRPFLTWHSQITATFHPALRSADFDLLSRNTFAANFAFQKPARVFGM
jgi:hypothetical protein